MRESHIVEGCLTVVFAEQSIPVKERLSFGRNADLELDVNPHLHRLVGEFAFMSGAWWVSNLGSRLFISVVSSDGTRVDLAPGARQMLMSERGSIRISVGLAKYELEYHLAAQISPEPVQSEPSTGATTDFQAVLTPREVDFLVTFAAPILDGSGDAIPSYAEVAARWSVSTKTLDNTLQSVKRKLRNARLARDEPLDTLVRIAISHSLISRSDLEWAELESDEPRPSSAGPRYSH